MKNLLRARVTVAVWFVTVVGTLHAPWLRAQFQSPSPAASGPGPTFEVVSIKPHDPADRYPLMGVTQYLPGGRIRATNIYVRALILQAYRTPERRLRSPQVVGAPGWIDSAGFDLNASLGTDITTEAFLAQLPELLRSLLEDRFNLRAHFELRPQPVYVLRKARSDGRLGPGLRPTTTDCEQFLRDRRANPQPPSRRLPGAPPPPCDWASIGVDKISARGYPIRSLAGSLNGAVDRTILDRIDLSGIFDIDLQWMPDAVRAGLQAPSPTASSDGASIFTALQEQLGLKLDATEEPLDVLVIDSIERPTPN